MNFFFLQAPRIKKLLTPQQNWAGYTLYHFHLSNNYQVFLLYLFYSHFTKKDCKEQSHKHSSHPVECRTTYRSKPSNPRVDISQPFRKIGLHTSIFPDYSHNTRSINSIPPPPSSSSPPPTSTTTKEDDEEERNPVCLAWPARTPPAPRPYSSAYFVRSLSPTPFL